MNMLMELRAEINDANSANRALKAEIKRLEAENKELRKGQIIRLTHAKEAAERLKAALQQIIERYETAEDGWPAEDMRAMARAALEPK